jgi:sialic acid synthase
MFSRLKSPSDAYIIAEVGQNHQGSLQEALKYVATFASLGASAIKFQIRNNKVLFDESFYDSVYNSENSFGATYGAHRDFLELSFEDHLKIRSKCSAVGVDYIVTPFDYPSLDLCKKLSCDAIKVASFDVGNIPFIHAISKLNIPVIVSTGGSDIDPIKYSLEEIIKIHSDIALLHCVSYYPCPADKVNLNKIRLLRELFPGIVLGLSDHFNGILTGPLAYLLGARVFEKHVTFDRSQKGTDHPFSLEPDGFRRFVRDIRRTPILMSSPDDHELGTEPVFKKLGKKITVKRSLSLNHTLTCDDISFIITSRDGINVRDTYKYLGRKLSAPIAESTPLLPSHFQ